MKADKPVASPVSSKLPSPFVTVVFTVGLYFGAQLLAGVVLAFIPSVLGWSPEAANAWLRNSSWAQFLFIAIVETITLWVLYKFLKNRQAGFRDIGLNDPKLRYLGQAVTGFILYFVVYLVILSVVSQLVPGLNTDQKQELGFNTTTSGSDLWPIFIALVILPPLTEEIVVRGFLYGGLKTKLKPATAALIASAIFAIAHLGEGGSGGLLWVAGIDTFILSMVLCYLRDKSGSLWPCIGVHMLKNGLAFVLLFNIVQYIK